MGKVGPVPCNQRTEGKLCGLERFPRADAAAHEESHGDRFYRIATDGHQLSGGAEFGQRRKQKIGAKKRYGPGLRAERVPCARYTCEARDGVKRPARRTRVISHASILFDAA